MARRTLPDSEFLKELARQLRDTKRLGAEHDEPEGTRFIQISSTIANDIADRIEEIANNISR